MKIVKIIFWLTAILLGFCVAFELGSLAEKNIGRYQLATTNSGEVWILDSETGELWTKASLGLLGDKPHPIFWSLGTPCDSSLDIVESVRESGIEKITTADIAEWRQILAAGMPLKPVSTQGLVTGIFYNPPNSSALIGGQIVYEGTTIHGVKVVKIHPDKIEFEKNGTSWTQRIEQTPDPAWQTEKTEKETSEDL